MKRPASVFALVPGGAKRSPASRGRQPPHCGRPPPRVSFANDAPATDADVLMVEMAPTSSTDDARRRADMAATPPPRGSVLHPTIIVLSLTARRGIPSAASGAASSSSDVSPWRHSRPQPAPLGGTTTPEYPPLDQHVLLGSPALKSGLRDGHVTNGWAAGNPPIPAHGDGGNT